MICPSLPLDLNLNHSSPPVSIPHHGVANKSPSGTGHSLVSLRKENRCTASNYPSQASQVKNCSDSVQHLHVPWKHFLSFSLCSVIVCICIWLCCECLLHMLSYSWSRVRDLLVLCLFACALRGTACWLTGLSLRIYWFGRSECWRHALDSSPSLMSL